MSAVSVHVAKTTGHAGFPPTVSIEGSDFCFYRREGIIHSGHKFAPPH